MAINDSFRYVSKIDKNEVVGNLQKNAVRIQASTNGVLVRAALIALRYCTERDATTNESTMERIINCDVLLSHTSNVARIASQLYAHAIGALLQGQVCCL